jgi:hypothetical protein
MRTTSSAGLVALVAGVLAVGCGVPKSEYDAVAVRADYEGKLTSREAEIAQLRTRVAALEAGNEVASSAARAELERVRAEMLDVARLREERASAAARLEAFEETAARAVASGKVEVNMHRGQIVVSLPGDALLEIEKIAVPPKDSVAKSLDGMLPDRL